MLLPAVVGVGLETLDSGPQLQIKAFYMDGDHNIIHILHNRHWLPQQPRMDDGEREEKMAIHHI